MNSAAIFKFKNTVFIRLNAAAFIKFFSVSNAVFISKSLF